MTRTRRNGVEPTPRRDCYDNTVVRWGRRFRLPTGLGFSPCARRKASVAKAFGYLCIRARLEPCRWIGRKVWLQPLRPQENPAASMRRPADVKGILLNRCPVGLLRNERSLPFPHLWNPLHRSRAQIG